MRLGSAPCAGPDAMLPCLLALDTSTDALAVGLCTPAGRWHLNEVGGPQASARLIPALMGLLQQAGIGWPQLQAIAYGQGPGAFTGLRTACAVAQGLAFAHGTPLLPIASLQIVAEDALAQADDSAGLGTLWVAMDARMDEVYAAAYHRPADHTPGWQASETPRLWTLPALADAWLASPPAAVAGSACTAFAERLPFGHARRWPEVGNRAAALLRLAEAAWQHGPRIRAADALPLYLRDKVAQTTAERLQAKAAATAAGA